MSSAADWAGVAATIFAGLGSFAAAGAAVWIALNAHKPKLKARITSMPKGVPFFTLTMENVGPKSVTFTHVELRVRGSVPEQREYNAVASSKYTEMPLNPNETPFHKPPALMNGEEEIVDSGKICTRCIPRAFWADATRDDLKKIIRTARDAKNMYFVVCTDCRVFPVKSERTVIAEIAQAADVEKYRLAAWMNNLKSMFARRKC